MEHRLALGIKEAADMVGLSHWQLRKYIHEGKLGCVRIGRRVLIEPNALQKLVAQGRSASDSNVYDLGKLAENSGEALQ